MSGLPRLLRRSLPVETGSPGGADRGATKNKVYNGVRTESVPPTRLFEDAFTTAQWRDKGFFSVIDSTQGMESSLLYNMLELGREQRFADNEKLPDDMVLGLKRINSCPTPAEFDDYADKHPMGGMPLAVSGLTDQEFATVREWLKQGAPLSYQTFSLSEDEQRQILAWEKMLNQQDKRHQLVARWLYEHLFLAHLYFGNDSDSKPDHFFKLYRSSTPPGEPVKPVDSVRPNDLPPSTSGTAWHRCAVAWSTRPTSPLPLTIKNWLAPANSFLPATGKWKSCPATAMNNRPIPS